MFSCDQPVFKNRKWSVWILLPERKGAFYRSNILESGKHDYYIIKLHALLQASWRGEDYWKEREIKERDDKEQRWQMQRCTRALRFLLEDLHLCNSKWKGHGWVQLFCNRNVSSSAAESLSTSEMTQVVYLEKAQSKTITFKYSLFGLMFIKIVYSD